RCGGPRPGLRQIPLARMSDPVLPSDRAACDARPLRPRAAVPPRSGRMRCPIGLAVVLAAAFAALPGTAGAVTFDDPAHFSVKRTFALPAAVPTPISGIGFSTNGNTLYVVGDADIETGGVWGIPVTRDPTTHEVTALGV